MSKCCNHDCRQGRDCPERKPTGREEFEALFAKIHPGTPRMLFERTSDDRRYCSMEAEYAWQTYQAMQPAKEVTGHAPRGWWVGEMRAILDAQTGSPISDDMRRAAGIVLKIVNGEKFDSNRLVWVPPNEIAAVLDQPNKENA